MLFNSFEFLYFFILMAVGFYIIPHKYRWGWLLLGSYYFYMASEPTLIILLFISTLVDYYCGLKIFLASNKRWKKSYLATSVIINVSILIAFKYLLFFTNTFNDILAFFGIKASLDQNLGSYSINQILLPVGISFYTFQTMSYSIEIYRGHIKPEKHLGKFALFVAFFPQLVAGPIEKASRLLPQLNKKITIDLANIKKGLLIMAWGFFLKVVVADRLGIYVDEAFNNPQTPHGLSLILGGLFFCFQIYYDFSAYTSIAIGAAKVLGYDLMQNFNRPFFATSSAAFWQRWHISLMQWMRDYLYRPLVVNLKLSRLSATFIVFFIIGLWHGANWTFVVWSLLNGLLLILEVATNRSRKIIIKKLMLPKKLVSFMGWGILLIYLMLSLIFFRSPSIELALVYFKNMTHLSSLHVDILNNYFELAFCFVLIFIVQAIHYFKGNRKVYELVTERPKHIRWLLYFGYIICIVLFGINRQSTFIYFQF